MTRLGEKVAAVASTEELKLIEALEDRIDLQDARKVLKDIINSNRLSCWSLAVYVVLALC